MQICHTHWAELRKAIADRGLTHLVSRSGEEAMASMKRQLEGSDTKQDYDPLLNANWAISGQYLNDVGLTGLVRNICPLCEVEKCRPGLAANWINGASDDQLAHARELGLAPSKQ